jgi:hypothetical protein
MPLLLTGPKVWNGFNDPPEITQTTLAEFGYMDYHWFHIIKDNIENYSKKY